MNAALQNIQGILVPFQISGELALLAHTMGNLERAIEHFYDALAFCRKAGCRPELAWTCCDYADTLLQLNEPGDREKAGVRLAAQPSQKRALFRFSWPQDGQIMLEFLVSVASRVHYNSVRYLKFGERRSRSKTHAKA